MSVSHQGASRFSKCFEFLESPRRVLSAALVVALVSTSSSYAASTSSYYFRYGDAGLSEGGKTPPPPDTPPGSVQMTLTPPSDISIRKLESLGPSVRAAPANAVGSVSYAISPDLPAGLSLNGDGSITGQALAAAPMTSYTITGKDSKGSVASASFRLTVEPRIPLEIAGVSSFSFEEFKTDMSFRLSPDEGSPLYGGAKWSVDPALPGWMGMTPDGDGIVVSGTPSSEDAAGFDLQFTLADDHDVSAAHVVHVDVTPSSAPSMTLPASIQNEVVFLADYTADIAANSSIRNVLIDDVTWSLVLEEPDDAMPPGLSLGDDGVLRGRPLAVGTFSFAIRADAPGGVTASRRYSVEVLPEAMSRVSSASHTTCMQTVAGDLKCWGDNTNGLLADGTTVVSSATPVSASTLSGKVVDVVGGYSGHMCALKEDGTVWCWGLGSSGQLGNGISSTSRNPVQVSGLTNVRSLVAGYKHTCAIKNDGSMWCWGEGWTIGDGLTTARNVPTQPTGMGSGVISMAAGNRYTCASKSDGTVWCWGANGNGRLGDGTTETRYSPVRVQGLTDVIAMTGGYDHTCAVKADRTVWCWGSAGFGQLGNGELSGDRLTPVEVAGMTDTYVLSTGDHHNCAIKTDRTAWCWGKGTDGQLGDGKKANSASPVKVQNLDNVSSITAIGYLHTCATRSDGSAWCWGDNGKGQLGNGVPNVDVSLPSRVSGT